MDEKEVEFSEGFFDMHNKSYKHILEGNGFGSQDTMTSIEIVYEIGNAALTSLQGDYHPMAKHKLSKHPFTGGN